MGRRGAEWLGLMCALLLLLPAGASATGGPLRFSAPMRIDHVRLHARAWSPDGISCPSAQLCVGAGDSGQVQTSVNPSAPDSWSGRVISPTDALQAVSCPS